jgi:enoyl-[acyl-carrier-protein] reductase (NADH)
VGHRQPLAQAGVRIAYSYQGERLRPTLEKLTEGQGATPARVRRHRRRAARRLFADLERDHGRLDYVVHALAYAPPATFEAPFVEVARDDWRSRWTCRPTRWSPSPTARAADARRRFDGDAHATSRPSGWCRTTT